MDSIITSDYLLFALEIFYIGYFSWSVRINRASYLKVLEHEFFGQILGKTLLLSIIPFIFYLFFISVFANKFLMLMSEHGGINISSYIVTLIISIYSLYVAQKATYYKICINTLRKRLER